jgi:hypothetical protein
MEQIKNNFEKTKQKKKTKGKIVIHCEIAVAAPAPAHPIFIPNIKTGSKSMLIKFPTKYNINFLYQNKISSVRNVG